MLPRVYVWLTVAIVILAAFEIGSYRGNLRGTTTERARWTALHLQAVEEALALERNRQKVVNDALQKQADDLATINNGLRADLERLRQRPSRPAMPANPGANPGCPGATGAELYREDAVFLSGEAARADRLRAALGACYTAYDALSLN